MKRLYSIAILFLLACGGDESSGDPSDPRSKPNKPNRHDGGSEPSDDAGPLAGDSGAEDGGVSDSGPRADSGQSPDSGQSADASTNDASAPGDASAGTFAGSWAVVLTATANTTCTNAQQYEARIEDTWVFSGATLTGDRLGPNPLTRVANSDVWELGESITADLELTGGELRGTFVFYWDACDVFYDVVGMRP
jgi:hypothetical protein